jgi:riboflavin transporter FmnP
VSSLVESGIVRAGLFFAAAFLVASALGALLGDLQMGMRSGILVALVMAVFGYVFVRPA